MNSMNSTMVADIPWLPAQDSAQAAQVDLLFICLLAIALVTLVLIGAAGLYFLIKYRRGSPANREPGKFSTLRLEITWTVVPFVSFLGLFIWAAILFFNMRRAPEDALEVHVIGKQWMWKIQHAQGKREINELHVPVGRSIKLILDSQDVIHSFYLPAFRIKQDAVPGRYTTEWFHPERTGTFRLYCSEYCGTYHSTMGGYVTVMQPAEYARWLASATNDLPMVQTGAALYRSFGCSGCHEPGGTVRAPPLEGIYGKPVAMQDGRILVADERYLRDCILIPQSQVVAGYDPVMPSFKDRLNEDQLYQLVTYIRSLSDRSPPQSAK
jgi:cytochrome c oxidase subunit II